MLVQLERLEPPVLAQLEPLALAQLEPLALAQLVRLEQLERGRQQPERLR